MMNASTVEFCMEMVLEYKNWQVQPQLRKIGKFVNFIPIIFDYINSSTGKAGLPSYKLVSEVDNFHKLAVNEKYQLWAEFST